MPRIRVDIVGDASSAVKAFKQTERQAEHLGREMRRAERGMDRFSRGMVAGSGVLGGLGRSVAFASSAFLGGAGLLYAFRKVTAEARNAAVVQARVSQAVRNSGNAWAQHKKHIDAVIQAQSRLAAFDDEELLDTFGHLVTRTKDVNRALELNALAANVARGRNMGLESASRLVLKASMGNVGALRRLGINLDKNATATEILLALQTRYARQAAKFGRTSAGAQERFNKTLEDSEEIIGRVLLPSIDKLLRRGEEWLDHQNRSGQLQKTVNQNFEAAEEILGGVADALKLIKTAAEPAIDAVGGIGNAVEVLTVLWVGMKVKAIFGFGATATASALTRTKVVADAAAMGAALDIATRPRVVPITVVGGGVGGIGAYGTGKLPRLPNRPTPKPSGGGNWFSRIFGSTKGLITSATAGAIAARATLPTGLPLLTVIAILASAGGGTKREDRSQKYPRVYKAVAQAALGKGDPYEADLLRRILGPYSLENAPDKLLAQAETQLRKRQRAIRQYQAGGAMSGPASGVKPGKGKGTGGAGGAAGGGTARTLPVVQRELARARAMGGDVRGLLVEERGIMRRQIAHLEKRGDLTEKEQTHLDQLYSDLAGVNAEIASMAKSSADTTKKKNKAAADAHQKAADAAREAAEKMQQSWQNARQQASQAFSGLFTGPILGGGFGDFIRQYGMQGATIDPKLILQDIKMQNQQTAGLIKNLQVLAKRGMPVGVMNQLREMGPEGAGFIASLASAPQKVFDAVVKALGVRQQQLEKATIFIQARNVTVKSGAAADVQGDKPPPRNVRTGGVIPGSGTSDTVPAMLTPGEMVLNRMQQGGLARAMGMPGAAGSSLFGAIQGMAQGGVAFVPGKRLDGRPWWERHGPRQWSPHYARGNPIAPLRRNIAPWLEQFYGRGMSPASGRGAASWWGENFSRIAQGFQGGGVVGRFNEWARDNAPQVGVLKKLGDWFSAPARTRGGRYASRQTTMFGETVIPTKAGVIAMGAFARDIGLGYLAPDLFTGKAGERARGRASGQASLMARSMIEAFQHPIANAGFLAGMFVPSPFKLTAPTRALTRLQTKLAKHANYPEVNAEGVALQPGNLRLRREKVNNRGLPRQFNRDAAESAARQAFQLMEAAGRKPKDVFPPGVKTVDDLVELQHDLFNQARVGKGAKHWYRDSGRELLAFAGGNRQEAHKLALLAALYSPRVSVEESMRRAARAWTEYKQRGSVPTKGVFDYQPGQAMSILDGSLTKLNGRKVNNFYLDLLTGIDPFFAKKKRHAGASTVDVWMQKALGYAPVWDPKKKGGPGFSLPGPTAGQYDFSEQMVASVASMLGWTPQQAQAAIWTTTKSRFEKRPPGKAGMHLGDFMRRQSTQINYEAAWGPLGARIKSELGMDAAEKYALEKFALLRSGTGGSAVLEKLGLLGTHANRQQGVWGVDVSPGAHELVLAPRFPESKRRFRMLPRFERSTREAAAIIGHILNQEGVGTLTEFPMMTAAGTVNSNVRAGRNAVWLSRELDNKELARVSGMLGERMLMLARPGGWILKPASNRVRSEVIMSRIRENLEGFKLDPATAHSGYVDSSEYMGLIARAAQRDPTLMAWVQGRRKMADAIDAKWAKKLMGPPAPVGRAGGGMIPGSGMGDTVPAMLTPGEMVLNRRQQAGISGALGLGRQTGSSLFSAIQRFQSGGVLSRGRSRSANSFLPGAGTMPATGPTYQQHNTITVPPEFADTQWAIERGLKSATWRLAKGI